MVAGSLVQTDLLLFSLHSPSKVGALPVSPRSLRSHFWHRQSCVFGQGVQVELQGRSVRRGKMLQGGVRREERTVRDSEEEKEESVVKMSFPNKCF